MAATGVFFMGALAACAQVLGLTDFDEGPYPPDAAIDGPGGDAGDAGDGGEAAASDPCTNTVLDLDLGETDIDCGGNTCGKCAKGKKCKVDSDCAKTCSDAGLCIGCDGVDFDAGGACIDAREVTVLEYDAFQKKVGERGVGGDRGCPMKVAPPSDLAQQLANSALPVRNVVWCSAFAFCKYRGKRLCGGFDGRPTDNATFNDDGRDQWMAACTGHGARAYPYGPVFDDGRCNDLGTAGPWDAGSVADCKTVGPEIYDMSGNVAEWEDSCVDGGRDGGTTCRVRGGSFASNEAGVACAANDLRDSRLESPQIGFRCCE